MSVLIVGDQSRIVLSASSLTLQSTLVDCRGSSVVGQEARYLWSVIDITNSNNTIDSSLKSSLVSLTGDKLKIPPFVLKPKSVYVVKVSVKMTANPDSSSSASIRVSQSSLVSRISGGSSQMVSQGESCVLDGSASYDPDISSSPSSTSQSSLSSEWSCVNVNVLNNTSSSSQSQSQSQNQQSPLPCSISVSSDGLKATVTPSPLSGVGSLFLVRLKIKDSKNSSRSSQSSVYLSISPAKSPKISVSLVGSSRPNSQDSLLLMGSVQLFAPNIPVVWSVDDVSLNAVLSSKSQTPTRSSSLVVGVNQFNLLISGGSLVWKPTPYVFSLSATSSSSTVYSSISVSLNRPPRSGSLSSNPWSGTVMNTSFHLSVSGWEDEDLPLSYEFFYLSNGKNTLRRQSEFTFVDSMLPLGSSSNGNQLDCWVKVFDSLNGFSSSVVSVVVKMPSLSSSSSLSSSLLLEKSTSLLVTSQNSGPVQSESVLQSVSLLSSILNWKDCSKAPDCSSLNRGACSSTTNTCGQCLSGYLGVVGDSNSQCVNETEYKNKNKKNGNGNNGGAVENVSCRVADCSGHGKCEFEKSDSGDKVSSCGLFESGCEAVCVCEAGFTGDDCGTSESDMSQLREIRSQMVSGLLLVASQELSGDVSEGNVLSMFSSLSSVTHSSWELSEDSSSSVLEALSLSLGGAQSLGLSHDSMSDDLFGCLDSVGLFQTRSSSSSSSNSNSNSNSSSTSQSILSLLDNFTEYMSSQVVEGQNSLDSINQMFRTRVEPVSLSDSFSSTIPQTKAELLSNTPSTSFSLISSSSNSNSNPNSSSSLSLVSMLVKSDLASPPSDPQSSLTSNLLRLRMSGSGSSSVSTITVVLQTLRSQSYPVFESDVFVNTSCVLNEVSETVHVCEGVLGNVTITHRCNGTTSGMLVSKCPRQSVQPSCHLPNDLSNFNCSMVNHTSTTVTCKCDRILSDNNNNNNNGNGRKLSSSSSDSALSESGALEVVAISVIVAEAFEETLTTTMTASDVKKVLVVILLYGLLWAVGLLGVLLCSLRYGYGKAGFETSSGKNGNSSLQMKKELASLTRSKDDIRQYLIAYGNFSSFLILIVLFHFLLQSIQNSE